MKKILVTNIEYDLCDSCGEYEDDLRDSCEEYEDDYFPKEMVVEVEDEDEIADYISDETGWLVKSYFVVGEV